MPPFSAATFITTLALVGVVVMVAALLSGVVDRWRLPQVAVFLLLGLVLGSNGLGLVVFGLTSPILQTIATIALVLVLFTDAVSVDVAWLDFVAARSQLEAHADTWAAQLASLPDLTAGLVKAVAFQV